MTVDTDTVRARRYLLGAATDEESAEIEQAYFEDDAAVDRIAAAEDDLIEDYLANQLSAPDHARFERNYLAVPQHRIRVETIRRLAADASSRAAERRSDAKLAPKRVIRYVPWLALAASLLMVAAVSLRVLAPSGRPDATIVTNQPAAAPPSPAAPNQAPKAAPSRVFAFTISPVAVRSASDAPTVVVPPGTDVVALRLERDAEARSLVPRRVSIRTVAGAGVWQGAVAAADASSQGIVARVDIPAANLTVDDYLVTLFGADSDGVEKEWTQYFLRVRDR
jgi:hypothetical protein